MLIRAGQGDAGKVGLGRGGHTERRRCGQCQGPSTGGAALRYTGSGQLAHHCGVTARYVL